MDRNPTKRIGPNLHLRASLPVPPDLRDFLHQAETFPQEILVRTSDGWLYRPVIVWRMTSLLRRLHTTGLSLSAAGILLSAACGRPGSTRTEAQTTRPHGLVNNAPESRPGVGNTEEHRALFLNRIRTSDPQKATIDRALLNEQNELGLILSRKANLDDIPKLMKAMLAQLDEAFPGQDHTVIAYTPTEPPRVIGTAHLNARTRDMTYQPASPSPH